MHTFSPNVNPETRESAHWRHPSSFTSSVPWHVHFQTVDVPLKYPLGIWQSHDHQTDPKTDPAEQSLHVWP